MRWINEATKSIFHLLQPSPKPGKATNFGFRVPCKASLIQERAQSSHISFTVAIRFKFAAVYFMIPSLSRSQGLTKQQSLNFFISSCTTVANLWGMFEALLKVKPAPTTFNWIDETTKFNDHDTVRSLCLPASGSWCNVNICKLQSHVSRGRKSSRRKSCLAQSNPCRAPDVWDNKV